MAANTLISRRNRLLQQLRDTSENFQNFVYVSTSSVPRLLAYSQFWLYFIYSSTLVFRYVVHWGMSRVPDNTMASLHGPDNNNEELSFDMSLFSQFSFNVLIMHSCYCLKKATFARNLEYIKYWMVVLIVKLLVFVPHVVLTSLRLELWLIFFIGTTILSVESFMLYVIYEFYLDELYALTADGYPMTSTCSGDQELVMIHKNHVVEVEF